MTSVAHRSQSDGTENIKGHLLQTCHTEWSMGRRWIMLMKHIIISLLSVPWWVFWVHCLLLETSFYSFLFTLDPTRLYSHWTVSLWEMRPFIPSTYSMIWPRAGKKNKKQGELINGQKCFKHKNKIVPAHVYFFLKMNL